MSDISSRLYRSAPRIVQNQLVSIKGAQFRWLRADQRTMLREFEKLLVSQYWSTEQFRIYQQRELQTLLAVAFDTVPYYQDLKRTLGCHPGDIKSVEDL